MALRNRSDVLSLKFLTSLHVYLGVHRVQPQSGCPPLYRYPVAEKRERRRLERLSGLVQEEYHIVSGIDALTVKPTTK